MAKKKYNDSDLLNQEVSDFDADKEFFEHQREEIKKQLSHFLINFRATNRLTQAQMGIKLGCSQQQYKRVEDGEEDRIANAISYIKKFADLNGSKKISDFVGYLVNEPPQVRASNLSSNEQVLVSAFAHVDREDRRLFIEGYCRDNNGLKFSKIVKILSLIPNISNEFLDIFTLSLMENKTCPDFIDLEEKKQMFEKLKQRQKRSYKRKNSDLVKN
ncbi:helix-turn-helix transcriptional regulator [Pigmentibacter sp. JX0631]|uniref:helix-turn-helix domain-containing protein n=1 Tax=Pigmentibacter sp. JX0631 TaxID=2976982 RepID=UPI0024699076|nr:helix-turn-helix transcriptional regulator [Pigmentibacter sp. JX0631]WGL58628.1 helix-turn-helix transcriptional regulator [Pigmentibacter sp. JX0631]